MQSPNIKPQYDRQIISSIRIFAICSILWGHCNFGLEAATLQNDSDVIFQSFAIQLGKMGTILFFIIAGILVQPKINSYTVFGFLKHRFFTTLLPWMIFVFLLVIVVLFNDVPSKFIMKNGTIWEQSHLAYQVCKNVVFFSAYWFVMVFIISMIILILFKKYVSNSKTGIILCLLTLFYGINLHYGWISAHHTKAFVGYVFIVWLGMHISKHYSWFIKWLDKIGWAILLPVLATTVVAASIEGADLTRIGCADPYASIRITNIIATTVLFLCLFKAGKVSAINRFLPDKVVYGVYLLHTVLLSQQTMLIQAFSKFLPLPHKVLSLIGIQTLDFIFILITSTVLVKVFYNRQAIAMRITTGLISIAVLTRKETTTHTNSLYSKIKVDFHSTNRFSGIGNIIPKSGNTIN